MIGRTNFWAVAVAALISAVPACRAQPAAADGAIPAPFQPSRVRSLTSFGAAGDGRVDDTSALARALAQSDRFCLDGEARTYRVTGTLRAEKNLCLRNATLVQSLAAFDTSAIIQGNCPVVADPAAAVNCGDRPVPPTQLLRLQQSLSVRTLLIRPADEAGRIRVNLSNLKMDRGRYPYGGSRADAAGVWIDHADRVDFRDVEITGDGKGFGLLIVRSRNVNLIRLSVHDMRWAPYPGDTPLSPSRVAAIGWNVVPIREFREGLGSVARQPRFYGTRIQEQLTCAHLADVEHVRIVELRIERCEARFDTGSLPWQADGLNIGGFSSDVVIKEAVIDSVWEGIDVVASGKGVDGFEIDGARISNAFGVGLKLGYDLRNATVRRLTVSNAGLAGIVVYGRVSAARISDSAITGVGLVLSRGAVLEPWSRYSRAGIRIDQGSSSELTPSDIVIDNVAVTNGAAGARYEFGLLNTGGTRVRVARFTAEGFRTAKTAGAPHR